MSADAEPLDPSALARLVEVTEAVQQAVRASFGSASACDVPEARRAFKEALKEADVPSVLTVAKRAIEALKAGRSVEDLAPTFARPEAALVEFDLRIEGVGLFQLDASLGEGLSLVEITLSVNPLPPPTILATLRVGRSFDERREDILDTL